MDAGQYYITTLTNAAMKLGPLVFYILAGYFLFIKLPFLLYYRNLQKSKNPQGSTQNNESIDMDFQKKMEEERRKEFEERMKNLGGNKQKDETKREDKSQSTGNQKKTSNENTAHRKKQHSQKPNEQIQATPEEILFKLKPGKTFTAQELKKIYHKLLKENHPDKFRTDHQKEYAEAKTKKINEAYQKLKKRVS
ncbi:MAG TPA: DnaJ domain-containing protein [Bacteriovoracaceae bacterium]|nr:DnaJ domain-containing protein [Bacteriovoracaceae bacterium]